MFVRKISWFCLLCIPSMSLAAHTCTLSTSSSLNFGLYEPMGNSASNGTGQVKVHCQGSGRLSFEIKMSGGNSGNANSRYMLNTGDGSTRLYYNIYTNNGRTKIWGDGTGGTYTQTKSKRNNFTYNKNVFGRIPASQTSASVGFYEDNLVVILDF